MFEPIRRRERFETSTVLPNRGSKVESRPDTLLLREAMGDASELCVRLRDVWGGIGRSRAISSEYTTS
jgi:hypothetical protein